MNESKHRTERTSNFGGKFGNFTNLMINNICGYIILKETYNSNNKTNNGKWETLKSLTIYPFIYDSFTYPFLRKACIQSS